MVNQHGEFEAYLSLLARFLKLSARQRDDIRRELESHLADAVEQAMEQGLSRDAAIQQAIEEFGDAAELASRFRQIGKTRRWIMRSTAVAACALATFAGFHLFAPDRQIGSLAAKDDPTLRAGLDSGARPVAIEDRQAVAVEDARIEAALNKAVAQVEMSDVPFERFIEWLEAQTQANVVVQWRAIEESGALPRDYPINLKLRNVSLARVLDLVFASVRDLEISYSIDDGVLVIGPVESLDRRQLLVVYDVRDLLEGIAAGYPSSASGQSGAPANTDGPSNRGNDSWINRNRGSAAQETTATGGAATVVSVTNAAGAGTRAQSELCSLVLYTVRPEGWDANGGRSAMRFINDTLVVRAPKSVHRELRELLEGLRTVMRNRASS